MIYGLVGAVATVAAFYSLCWESCRDVRDLLLGWEIFSVVVLALTGFIFGVMTERMILALRVL